MDITTKYNIIAQIINSTDEHFLASAESLVKSDKGDFWNVLSEEDKTAINDGLAQLDRGEFVLHNAVQNSIKKKLDF